MHQSPLQVLTELNHLWWRAVTTCNTNTSCQNSVSHLHAAQLNGIFQDLVSGHSYLFPTLNFFLWLPSNLNTEAWNDWTTLVDSLRDNPPPLPPSLPVWVLVRDRSGWLSRYWKWVLLLSWDWIVTACLKSQTSGLKWEGIWLVFLSRWSLKSCWG